MCRSSSLHSLALFAQLFNRDGADKHCYIRTLDFTDVNIKSGPSETDQCPFFSSDHHRETSDDEACERERTEHVYVLNTCATTKA